MTKFRAGLDILGPKTRTKNGVFYILIYIYIYIYIN